MPQVCIQLPFHSSGVVILLLWLGDSLVSDSAEQPLLKWPISPIVCSPTLSIAPFSLILSFKLSLSFFFFFSRFLGWQKPLILQRFCLSFLIISLLLTVYLWNGYKDREFLPLFLVFVLSCNPPPPPPTHTLTGSTGLKVFSLIASGGHSIKHGLLYFANWLPASKCSVRDCMWDHEWVQLPAYVDVLMYSLGNTFK